MEKFTRKELKQDKFAAEVTHTVDFLAEHRAQAIKYGAAGLIAVALIIGFFTWRSYQRSQARAALVAALEVRQARVGAPQGDSPVKTYPDQASKTKAEIAAFSDVASKYSGTEQGTIAQYYLAAIAADQGNLAAAEKAYQEVIDSGDANYASLAKVSLAEIYKSQGKSADGEKLLRSLIANPSAFISKDEATIILARYLAQSNPAEARKLLEPLRTARSAISRAALSELSSLPK